MIDNLEDLPEHIRAAIEAENAAIDAATADTRADIEAQVAAFNAALDADKPKDYILYPDMVTDKSGLVKVTPELIDSLLQDYLFDRHSKRTKVHREGDVSLRVHYDDLKALMELSGATVREIRFIQPEEGTE